MLLVFIAAECESSRSKSPKWPAYIVISVSSVSRDIVTVGRETVAVVRNFSYASRGGLLSITELQKLDDDRFWRKQSGREEASVKWATRERIRMDRAASAWLILRFVDKDAAFEFVPTKGALELAQAEGAIPFVIPGAELSRKEDKITFDAILEKYALRDPALHKLALIVREADISGSGSVSPEAPGFRAILHGFFLLDMPDPDTLRLELPIFDALYRFCQGKHIRD